MAAGWRGAAPLLLLVTLLLPHGAPGVTITNLKVPSTVQNGSSGTILDCEYSLLPDEAQPTSGLVIKWYFNSRPAPVYQWIPTQKPQDLDLLRGRLDMNYTATSHAAMEHRALRILNATTDLSGEWKCSVSTFKNEDFMIKKMIVFVPEKGFEVIKSKTNPPDHVNVTCRAHGVFPEPRMNLYRDPAPSGAAGKSHGLPGVTVSTVSRQGVFDITAWTLMPESEIENPTILECELRLPDANYTKRKRILVYSGSMGFLSAAADPRVQPVLWTAFLVVLMPLVRIC
ncbi:uncharacterized protein LOC113213117 isoform X1 [Frankliniella occidentalis]|uniref:Uncharacterized protein LOC113213117 isoform X1 n=1 Tax=Frankliniella occidentalis TaxID=133901 RepID=A0A9C6TZX0_FRAOC|nr:uncharacterized protein LOC113213117 isoform X1 [Frankliniella occidentalis]